MYGRYYIFIRIIFFYKNIYIEFIIILAHTVYDANLCATNYALADRQNVISIVVQNEILVYRRV